MTARPRTIVVASCLALVVGTVLLLARRDTGPEVELKDVQHEAKRALDVDAGICPWRHPDVDVIQFFHGADSVQDSTVILSSKRLEVTRRLGHQPGVGDNALRVHHILRNGQRIGTILTRYVRGESGAIELVLAVDHENRVIGASIQRLREPDEVAKILKSPQWLSSFHGKTARSKWQLGDDIPSVSAAARTSAQALVENAQTVLVLLEVGQSASSTGEKRS